MSAYDPLDVAYDGLVISVRLRWVVLPTGGAVRVRDRAIWMNARSCRGCHVLGYDHGDIDAAIEAQRLGVDRAPHVAASAQVCSACGCS